LTHPVSDALEDAPMMAIDAGWNSLSNGCILLVGIALAAFRISDFFRQYCIWGGEVSITGVAGFSQLIEK
jgi:hypothetical protein